MFLQLEAMDGEQWAPVKKDLDGDDPQDDVYVLIGTLSNNPTTTCHTYRHFNDGEMPQWGLDGSRPELKKYILCCKDPQYMSEGLTNPAVDLTLGAPEISVEEDLDVEAEIGNELQPEWLDFKDGWLGGSHKDAEVFCQSRGGRQICPYAGKILVCALINFGTG